MKVAIYCRLSEEDRNKQNKNDDSESIQNQKSLLLQYAIGEKWEVYNIYSDDDYAGADRNRPAFNQLISDAEDKKFDIILCKTQSRFTRELELVEKYIHTLFPMWGIRFISVVDNADTAVKGNKKARQINGLINEWYLEDMSDNIRSVLTSRRQNGNHIGAFALYGYRKDPDKKGHLIIDEEAAHIVREVFNMFAAGYGKINIARILNDRGVPNPTEYKRLKGLRYKQPKGSSGTLWKYSAIANMLINEIYIGNMIQGKYGSVSYKTKQNKPLPKEKWIRVEGTHKPVIDTELWNRVQELVGIKAKPFIVGNIGIFSRKIKCIHCGYFMRSAKTKDRHYMRCQTRHVGKNVCIGAHIAVKTLSEVVVFELKKLSEQYLDRENLDSLIDNIDFNDDNGDDGYTIIGNNIAEYENQIADFDKAIKSLYLDKVKNIIDDNQFIEYSRDFHDNKKKLEKLIEQLKSTTDTRNDKIYDSSERRQILKQYAELAEVDRDIVDKLIDCIYVGKRDFETKQMPIEIHWNF